MARYRGNIADYSDYSYAEEERESTVNYKQLQDQPRQLRVCAHDTADCMERDKE